MEQVQAGFARHSGEVARFARLREWLARRRIRASLKGASVGMLQDAGLTRADIEAALALPLSRDASLALFGAAEARTGNW